jgi:hypothetical protein
MGPLSNKVEPRAVYLQVAGSVAPGRLYSHADLEALFEPRGLTPTSLENHVKRLALLPWLSIDRVDGGYVFTVDCALKELCERTNEAHLHR